MVSPVRVQPAGIALMAFALIMIYLLPRFLPERYRLPCKLAGLLALAAGAFWAIRG